MALNPDVVEGVVATNFKVLAEQTAVQTNHTSAQFAQAAANAVANQVADQQEMRALSRVTIGALMKRMIDYPIDWRRGTASSLRPSRSSPLRASS